MLARITLVKSLVLVLSTGLQYCSCMIFHDVSVIGYSNLDPGSSRNIVAYSGRGYGQLCQLGHKLSLYRWLFGKWTMPNLAEFKFVGADNQTCWLNSVWSILSLSVAI